MRILQAIMSHGNMIKGRRQKATARFQSDLPRAVLASPPLYVKHTDNVEKRYWIHVYSNISGF